MALLVLMLTIFTAVLLISLVSTLASGREHTHESAQEAGEVFGLKEGQTIMAVVEEKRTLYFCIGRDRKKHVQKDEE